MPSTLTGSLAVECRDVGLDDAVVCVALAPVPDPGPDLTQLFGLEVKTDVGVGMVEAEVASPSVE